MRFMAQGRCALSCVGFYFVGCLFFFFFYDFVSLIYTRFRIFMNEVTLRGWTQLLSIFSPFFIAHKLFAPFFLSLSEIHFLQPQRQPVAYKAATSVELTQYRGSKLFVTRWFYVTDMTLSRLRENIFHKYIYVRFW